MDSLSHQPVDAAAEISDAEARSEAFSNSCDFSSSMYPFLSGVYQVKFENLVSKYNRAIESLRNVERQLQELEEGSTFNEDQPAMLEEMYDRFTQ